MILQVPADPWKVRDDLDTVRAEVIGGTDARKHQELGRADGARGQDDLLPGAGLLRPTVVEIVQADGAAVLEADAGHQAVRTHREVGAVANGGQIAGRRRAPPLASGRRLIDAGACLCPAIEIGGIRYAGFLAGLDEHLGEPVGRHRRDALRPADTVIFVDEDVVVFRLPEIRLDLFEGPAKAVLVARPPVVVLGTAAGEDLAVYRAAATDHTTLHEQHLSIPGMSLRRGPEVPGDVAVVELIQPRRPMDVGIAVDWAGFEQKHARVHHLAQSTRDHRTGRPGTDDDVVKGLHGRRHT